MGYTIFEKNYMLWLYTIWGISDSIEIFPFYATIRTGSMKSEKHITSLWAWSYLFLQDYVHVSLNHHNNGFYYMPLYFTITSKLITKQNDSSASTSVTLIII